jgi:hypothetical protein
MNWDEIKSAVGQIATAVCFFAVGAGLITGAQSSEVVKDLTGIVAAIGTLAPLVAGLVSVASSIYRHWNQKKVPENSTAIATATPVPVGTLLPAAVAAAAKVVGVLLIGFLVLHAAPAMAQAVQPQFHFGAPAKPAASPSVAAVPKAAAAKAAPAAASQQTLDPLAWLRQFSTDDVANALKDAQAQNNLTTIPCWTFIQTLLGASPSASLLPNQLGLATGIQKIFDDETLLANWLVPNGTLDQLNIACDPMINKLKMQGVAGGAAIATAIAAGPAGIPALLSGLGAILSGVTALTPLAL